MKRLFLFFSSYFLLVACSTMVAAPSFEGLWADDARQFPTNPQEFTSICKLNDGRFFILLCENTREHKPIWRTSIGDVKEEILYFKFNDGEWRFKLANNKQKVESLIMSDMPDSNIILSFIRVSSEPIKKLEGTVRGEAFTK